MYYAKKASVLDEVREIAYERSITHYHNFRVQIFSYRWAVNKYLKNNFTGVLSLQESGKIQMTFLFLEQVCHFF